MKTVNLKTNAGTNQCVRALVGANHIRPILLTLIICMFLVSCNGEGSKQKNQSTAATPETKIEQVAPDDITSSTNPAATYLAQFGLTEDDIKPEGFVSFEGPDEWLIKITAGEGNANAWSKRIFDKIKSISTDGKVYDQGYPRFKEEASWTDDGTIYQWAYPYKGKIVVVEVIPPTETVSLYRIALHFQ